MEISGFRNFSFGLVVNPITMQNFSFLGHLEVPEHFPPATHKQTDRHNIALYIYRLALRAEWGGFASPRIDVPRI